MRNVKRSFFFSILFSQTPNIWWCSRVLVLPTYFYKMCVCVWIHGQHLLGLCEYSGRNSLFEFYFTNLLEWGCKKLGLYVMTKICAELWVSNLMNFLTLCLWQNKKRISLLLFRSMHFRHHKWWWWSLPKLHKRTLLSYATFDRWTFYVIKYH